MIRRHPRSTRTDTLFPTRRSSDLVAAASLSNLSFDDKATVMLSDIGDGLSKPVFFRDLFALVRVGCEAFYRLGLIRSEEHTFELQSLMRISYAVFCLKKKK